MAASYGIDTLERFGALSVKLNPAPAGFHSGGRLGFPAVSAGAATITPRSIFSVENVGAAKVPGGTQTIKPLGIRSSEQLGALSPSVVTVFMVPGFGDLTELIGWTGITSLNFQLQGKITGGNTNIAIAYNNFGLDSGWAILGPALGVTPDELTSLQAGRTALNNALLATPGPKVVFAHSLGAMVSTMWLNDIGPTSPIPPSQLSFVFIGNPFRRYGGFMYNASNDFNVPIATPYKVLDIAKQYDFFADQPNLPTSPNYLTALTSILEGGLFVHVNYFNVDPTDTTLPTFVEGNITYRLAPTLPWWEPSYALPLIESAYNRPEVFGGAVAPPIPALPQPQAFAQPAKRYPAGPITPHGAYHLLEGDTPTVKLTAYDNSIVFSLLGGESIPDRTMPESVQIKGLKGLVPPWKQIDQKGATQDGKTFITSLYDPAEIEILAVARGRNPQYTRQVYRDLIASIDAIQASQLSWFTHDLGYWWSDVRWQAAPADPMDGIDTNRQPISLRLRAYDSFWRSYDYADQFGFTYQDVLDDFSIPVAHGLGANWTIATQGYPGVGFIYVDGAEAIWSPDTSAYYYPAVVATTIARRNGYTSTGDNQVVTTTFTTFAGSYWANDSFNDIWARMKSTGLPGSDGVRLRIGAGSLTLSYFKAGVETVLRKELLLIPPIPGETWTLVVGSLVVNTLGQTVIDPRAFTVLRNKINIMSVAEIGTGSQIGSAFRSVGFGMYAGQGLFNQSTPAAVGSWSAADNSTFTQDGFIRAINGGDQPMWERFTCFGPGTFNIGDGPDAAEFVQLGPLLPNQIVQVRTDPRKYAVVDLTSKPPQQQDLNFWEQALKDYISFATGGNVTVQLQQLESLFGIIPPQGNIYSLLSGRFTTPVPARSPGYPLQAYKIPVSIEGGNAASAIIGAGTPLRRLPY